MKVPNYLHLAPSGVWFFRARVAGRIVKRSLHTRDRLTAQRQALTLAWWHNAGMGHNKDNDWEAIGREYAERLGIRRYEVSGPGGFTLRTDGSERDNADGLRALEILARNLRPVAQPSAAAHPSVERVPIALAAKTWEGTLADNKPKTRTIKTAAITSFVNHVGKTKILADCGRLDVGNWVDALRAANLSTPTLVNKTTYLAGFFKWAAGHGYYPQHADNPARGQVAFGPRAKRARRGEGFRSFTPAHIAALYAPDAIAKLSEGARWGALVGLYIGARVSEVLISDDPQPRVA